VEIIGSMTKDKLTQDELTNLDKLEFFYNEKIKVHLKLRRTDNFGKNIFLNGFIKERLTDTLFLMDERLLGELRVSLFEIKIDGVGEFR
jgi:hypothetical protein